jgi:hypothetical protein
MLTCEGISLENIGTAPFLVSSLFSLIYSRAYMDNEITQAILFQYIGMQWSVAFKGAFRSFVQSRAWKSDMTHLTREQIRRHDNFFRRSRGRGGYAGRTVGARRKTTQLDNFFLAQLPGKIESETPYDEEPKSGEKPNQGLNAQQVLLRLVSTEAHLKRALHGSCTIVRADLEWFAYVFFSFFQSTEHHHSGLALHCLTTLSWPFSSSLGCQSFG